MIIDVANPIYDSVFKYFMEDERIAKTMLSALLKKEVDQVKVRPHEYANSTRDKISMFRIDFAATVRQEDGTRKTVLIELQKTWLPTETLRFRQYLGAQYGNPQNMSEESGKRYAYPMVAIYLLGHRLGDITEPVVYVDHKTYNYAGNEVKDGENDPFIKSLTHNSIIVQIPLLSGKITNRLEKVLSLFDQSRINPENQQLLEIDDSDFDGDSDMTYMVHRLVMAAASWKVRQDMNAEDEFFSEIENRDTALMMKEQKLKEKEEQLKKKDVQLEKQSAQLKEKDERLEEQAVRLKEKDERLKEKDTMLYDMVRGLISSGIPLERIAQMTGKSPEEIERIMKKYL